MIYTVPKFTENALLGLIISDKINTIYIKLVMQILLSFVNMISAFLYKVEIKNVYVGY